MKTAPDPLGVWNSQFIIRPIDFMRKHPLRTPKKFMKLESIKSLINNFLRLLTAVVPGDVEYIIIGVFQYRCSTTVF